MGVGWGIKGFEEYLWTYCLAGQRMSEGEEEEEKGMNERGIKEGVLCKTLKTERWMNRWMDE